MRKTTALFIFSLLIVFSISAQTTATSTIKEEKTPSGPNQLNPDYSVTSEHSVTIKGKQIPYKATAGSIPVWSDSGKLLAGVFYTYYERSDVKDKADRPLVISFNGGPG